MKTDPNNLLGTASIIKDSNFVVLFVFACFYFLQPSFFIKNENQRRKALPFFIKNENQRRKALPEDMLHVRQALC
jgi:hypothetical protein